MTIPFDMHRLHHGCGESLRIKSCVLPGISRQAERMNQPTYGPVFSDRHTREIYRVTKTAERHWE